jgi:hypothetical protein
MLKPGNHPKSRGGTGFTAEAFQRLAVLNNIGGEKLQSDEPAEFRVLRLIHHTHPAAAQLLDDAVM